MDLRQLRYFLSIADAGSISAAAGRLNVAQPALSLHIRNMERHLGTDLFMRRARGVSLTEAGEILAQRARVILDEVARAEDDIRNLGSDPRGEVRLGLPGTLSGILSVPLVLAASERFPNVRLTIAEAMSGFVLDWLHEHRVDLALLYAGEPDPRFQSELLMSEELVVFAPIGWDLTDPCPPGNLADLPLILPGPAHGLRGMLEDWAGRTGIHLRTECEIDSYRNIKDLVMAGHGCSILPRHAVIQDAAAGRLRLAPIAEPRLRRDVYLVQRQPGKSSHACDVIVPLIRELVTEMAGAGVWAGVVPAGRGAAGEGLSSAFQAEKRASDVVGRLP
ncbi:MAG: LysR family transcriptional regulator [Rhodospirillum sp.]|nr:LysR family transcriptional regulator [Rhodospirillum sp.]MCF8489475.1 LysR family transcriptional regulator [Rhodospirillum sp.]MCF8500809.1 LysR family transcriptional regulator [Rhodospirillum sp.]